jgi:hypothetical protein
MVRIRLATVNMAPIQTDLVRTLIGAYATIDMVGDFSSCTEAENSLTEIAPDLILVGLHSDESDVVVHNLLGLAPFANVVAIPIDAGGAYLYKASGHRIDLSQKSSQDVAKSILDVRQN